MKSLWLNGQQVAHGVTRNRNGRKIQQRQSSIWRHYADCLAAAVRVTDRQGLANARGVVGPKCSYLAHVLYQNYLSNFSPFLDRALFAFSTSRILSLCSALIGWHDYSSRGHLLFVFLEQALIVILIFQHVHYQRRSQYTRTSSVVLVEYAIVCW